MQSRHEFLRGKHFPFWGRSTGLNKAEDLSGGQEHRRGAPQHHRLPRSENGTILVLHHENTGKSAKHGKHHELTKRHVHLTKCSGTLLQRKSREEPTQSAPAYLGPNTPPGEEARDKRSLGLRQRRWSQIRTHWHLQQQTANELEIQAVLLPLDANTVFKFRVPKIEDHWHENL